MIVPVIVGVLLQWIAIPTFGATRRACLSNAVGVWQTPEPRSLLDLSAWALGRETVHIYSYTDGNTSTSTCPRTSNLACIYSESLESEIDSVDKFARVP